MRIKSYFAASVQAAIAMARREFGDGVTLVTSHIAAPDARQFGEYEVVFAIEDQQEAEAETPAAVSAENPSEEVPPSRFTEFQQVLLDAVQPKAVEPDGLTVKLERLRCALIDLGLDPQTTAAVVTLVEKSIPGLAVAMVDQPGNSGSENLHSLRVLDAAEQKTSSVVTLPLRRHSHLSAAELSFISSVSGSPGTEAVQIR
jgi:hypothetical protein